MSDDMEKIVQQIFDPSAETLEDLAKTYLEAVMPYQELVNHLMKPRDGYFDLVSKFNGSDISAINRIREELEYYEGLWNEAREICRRNNFQYIERHSSETKEESIEPKP